MFYSLCSLIVTGICAILYCNPTDILLHIQTTLYPLSLILPIMEQTASPAKYTKEDIDRIARSASFVENLCIAMNIINDSVAMHGDLMVKQDIGNIQRAHELLKNTVDSISERIKKETNDDMDFKIDTW